MHTAHTLIIISDDPLVGSWVNNFSVLAQGCSSGCRLQSERHLSANPRKALALLRYITLKGMAPH